MVRAMATENEPSTIPAPRPVACTLSSEAASQQLLEWRQLQRRAQEMAPIEGGVRMTFPATMIDVVEELATREGACCSFLNFVTVVSGDVLSLEVTTAHPDGPSFIGMLAGDQLP